MSTTETTATQVPSPRRDMGPEESVDTAIDEACRALHLPTIRRRVQEMAGAAMRQRFSYKDFLADLLEAECAERVERRKQRLVRDASFPRPKRLEDFDFEENLNVTPESVGTLSDPAWVKAGQPLCLIGDSGTGKSHLLIGIGTAMAEAADEKKLTRTIARYGRVDLLCLDEFGCAPRGADESRGMRGPPPVLAGTG
ncbi:ATP-binding protein [Streptomyces sp. NPDC056704]|uniref:ATP-binding protein n=1 Tax=Streptomyces sp. NPDC056704 TaxID=3345917 RepID=UPI00368F3234